MGEVDGTRDADESELRARIAQLEADNRALTSRLARREPAITTTRPGRTRAVVGTVLIVLAAVLTPVAVVATWARATLTDSDGFIATYAPLAREPAVQSFLVDQAVAAIDQRTDIDQVVDDIVSGLIPDGSRRVGRVSRLLSPSDGPTRESRNRRY